MMDFTQLIGRTPLVFLKKVTEGCGAYVAVKQEMMQPTASIKDRYLISSITCTVIWLMQLKMLQPRDVKFVARVDYLLLVYHRCRPAMAMIRDAEEKGLISPGKVWSVDFILLEDI